MSKLKLGNRSFEDVKADSYEVCVFKYRNQNYELRCKILTIIFEFYFIMGYCLSQGFYISNSEKLIYFYEFMQQ